MPASVSLKQGLSKRTDVALHMAQYCLMIVGLIFCMGFINTAIGEPVAESAPVVSSDLATADNPAEKGEVIARAAISPSVAVKPVAAEVLPPQMHGALSYVAQRYKVSAEAVRPIFEAAHRVGQERQIDPLLIVAIIGIESSFNPFAESSFGAQGLMQVIPRFHKDKVPQGAGNRAFFDPATNIRIGVSVLQEAIQRRGGLTAGLQQYAGSTDPSGWYANKVMAEKARLEQAAKRNSMI